MPESPSFVPTSSHSMPGETTCVNRTVDDIKGTAIASQIIMISCSSFFYLVVVSLSGLSTCFPWAKRLLSIPVTYVLFLVGALMVSINIFTNEGDLMFREYYQISSGSFVGILYVIGGCKFFQKPSSCTTSTCRGRVRVDQPRLLEVSASNVTLGDQQPFMGFVVGIITFFLLAIESLLIVFSAKKEIGPEPESKVWKYFLTGELVFLLQKGVQALTYGLLRSKKPSQRFGKESAAFYFKVLSFFNLVQWLDAVINLHHDIEFSSEYRFAGPIFGKILETVYEALLIDYRLLCSLLFLEHALEINEEVHAGKGREGSPPDAQSEERILPSVRDKTWLGVMVGTCCILVLSMPVAKYFFKVDLGPWVHVFSVIVYLILFGCGWTLLAKNKLVIRHQSDKESVGIKITVRK